MLQPKPQFQRVKVLTSNVSSNLRRKKTPGILQGAIYIEQSNKPLFYTLTRG